MTRLARPTRLFLVTSSCVVLTGAPAVVSAAAPTFAPETPTVQVVLPVVDGGITVVVAPGTATPPGAGPSGTTGAPAPPGTSSVVPPVAPSAATPSRCTETPPPAGGSTPAPTATPTVTAPSTTAPTAPVAAGEASEGTSDDERAVSGPSSPTTGSPTTTSPTTGSVRTCPPLPTARPTYEGGSTTPPPTDPAPDSSSGPGATTVPTPGGSSAPLGEATDAGPSAAPGAPSASRRTAPGSQESSATGGFRFGVFGHSADRVGRFQEKVGRPVEVLGVFPARGSWKTIMDTWWLDTAPPGFQGTLDVGVPLWQDDGDLATAAAGGYDAQWEELGRTIEAKYPGSSVRIGWEFNLGGWMHHATDENVEQWTEAFRRASAALKKGGPSLLVTWNPNKGKGDSLADASKAWPGDGAVDIIALDAYDWWPAYSESTWPEHRDGDQGWKYWVDFARSHGKKFAVPEWGVAPGNDHGGGDNPYYIGVVMDFLAAEHAKDGIVHSIVYFDEPESYIANSIGDGQVPLAGEALAGRLAALGGTTGEGARSGAASGGGSGTAGSSGTSGAGASPAPSTGATSSPTVRDGRSDAAGSPTRRQDGTGGGAGGSTTDERGRRENGDGGGGDRATGEHRGSGDGEAARPPGGATSGGGSGWSSGDRHGPVPR
ncbi:glycoside hydrolase family 26 protein [Mobilicoccus pelagius]|uniref:GH26 domain-containing protein n=1 Tax=Mobilicoccus pelagius NBRC 104925 TaxID=1089455 RepID=H5UPZ2_9MICO|nr:hypothetical protein [Mobilicoccus pelagius]GAB47797.1 hypothetical protein MOPEL_029_00780 [Mobilicoccus pelagius NBRC 104925]